MTISLAAMQAFKNRQNKARLSAGRRRRRRSKDASLRHTPPTGAIEGEIGRIRRQGRHQVLVRPFQIVIRHRREEVVQGVVADRERKEEQRERVVSAEVAGVGDVRGHVDTAAIAFAVVIGEEAELIERDRRHGQRIEQRNPRPGIEPQNHEQRDHCLLYTSPSPRDRTRSRMPSSA